MKEMKRNWNKDWAVDICNVGNYDDVKSRRLSIAKGLCDEIYFKAMPEEVVEFNKWGCCGLLVKFICETMDKLELWQFAIIYDRDNKEMPDKECKSIKYIDPQVCLLNQRVSMSIEKFLMRFQSKGESDFIEKQTKIPKNRQAFVYQKIVDYIYQQLIEEKKSYSALKEE